jgi:DNA-binding transcriptional LysR family regulator
MRDFDWNLVKSFLAVLDAGSLAGAVAATGLSQPTLGRHIDELEASLGATLFARGRAGMVPTETALAVAAAARAMRDADAAIGMAVAGHSGAVEGTVRITASDIVATFILPAILADLLADLPGIAVELAPSNEQANLLQRDADIAVRMVRPMQNDLIARKVNEMHMGAYAHRDYLARAGTPIGFGDLAGHVVIGYDRSTLIIDHMRRLGLEADREFFRFRCDDQVAAWRALCDGVGIGFGPNFLANREPALVRTLPDIGIEPLPVWLVSHRELRTSARIRAVSDYLGERLAALPLARDYAQEASAPG